MFPNLYKIKRFIQSEFFLLIHHQHMWNGVAFVQLSQVSTSWPSLPSCLFLAACLYFW